MRQGCPMSWHCQGPGLSGLRGWIHILLPPHSGTSGKKVSLAEPGSALWEAGML